MLGLQGDRLRGGEAGEAAMTEPGNAGESAEDDAYG